MITTCIDHLKSALAGTPAASALEALDPSELQQCLEALGLETICLRPWDCHRYGVLALLYRLPDLRPEPRIVIVNYLRSNIDFSRSTTDRYISEETGKASISEPEPGTDPAPPPRAHIRTEDPAAPQPTRLDVTPCFAKRPDDLFDRFLNWIAALVS